MTPPPCNTSVVIHEVEPEQPHRHQLQACQKHHDSRHTASDQQVADAKQRDRDKESDEELTEEEQREKKIRSVKRAARSELSVSRGDWHKHKVAQSNLLSTEGLNDTVPRVHCKDLSVEQFIERYERPRIPVVLTGLADDWPAQQNWTPEALTRRFADHKFKVGSDDEGYAVRMRFAWYMWYCNSPAHGQLDDSPLYIFDGTFSDRTGSKALLDDYKVPPYFTEDLYQHAGERRRPPYRWLVLGPARSGSGLHIDPLATNAWNTLVSGHKRWVLFPPGTPKELILPKEEGLEREAVSWFSKVYPRTRAPGWPGPPPIDLIQGPGETVFVPGGWWHAVLNLDLTIAVTQNYCSSANFERVWKHTVKGRPKLSKRWLEALRLRRPDLAAVADAINEAGDVECSTSSTSSSSSSSSSSSDDDSSSGSSSDEEEEVQQQSRERRANGGDGGHDGSGRPEKRCHVAAESAGVALGGCSQRDPGHEREREPMAQDQDRGSDRDRRDGRDDGWDRHREQDRGSGGRRVRSYDDRDVSGSGRDSGDRRRERHSRDERDERCSRDGRTERYSSRDERGARYSRDGCAGYSRDDRERDRSDGGRQSDSRERRSRSRSRGRGGTDRGDRGDHGYGCDYERGYSRRDREGYQGRERDRGQDRGRGSGGRYGEDTSGRSEGERDRRRMER